jgi:putative spermidine/putrescine transport system permease protein
MHLVYGLLIVGLLLPMLSLIYLSVVQQWSYPQLWDAAFTWENWGNALGGTDGLLASFVTSALLALTIGLVATAGGFVVGRAIMYHRRQRWLLSLAYYPYLIAPVVLGVMLQFYFIKLGITGTVVGVIVAQFLFIFPYAVLYFAGFWTAQTRAIEGQATTLGASRWQVYRKVLLPMARPWLAICFFQCFMISWFEYGVTQYVGIGKVSTLTVRTMQYVKEANPHVAAVAACLMVLPLVAFLLLNRRLLIRNAQSHD